MALKQIQYIGEDRKDIPAFDTHKVGGGGGGGGGVAGLKVA